MKIGSFNLLHVFSAVILLGFMLNIFTIILSQKKTSKSGIIGAIMALIGHAALTGVYDMTHPSTRTIAYMLFFSFMIYIFRYKEQMCVKCFMQIMSLSCIYFFINYIPKYGINLPGIISGALLFITGILYLFFFGMCLMASFGKNIVTAEHLKTSKMMDNVIDAIVLLFGFYYNMRTIWDAKQYPLCIIIQVFYALFLWYMIEKKYRYTGNYIRPATILSLLSTLAIIAPIPQGYKIIPQIVLMAILFINCMLLLRIMDKSNIEEFNTEKTSTEEGV